MLMACVLALNIGAPLYVDCAIAVLAKDICSIEQPKAIMSFPLLKENAVTPSDTLIKVEP